jgi:glycosyltransferase involved in cell wall biosynthesis
MAIASVADQEGIDVEHIVQDCGTEGIQDFFEQIAKTSDRYSYRPRLFVEKDLGMYDAINRGLARARGDICAYLNCDEQYLPGALGKIERYFATNADIDVVFGDVILVDENGTPVSYRRTVLPTKLHIRLSHLNTSTCATFFRRALLDRGFYFDSNWKTIGDAVWIERLLRNGVKMASFREPLAVFTLTGGNLGASEVSRSEVLRWRGPSSTYKRLQQLAIVFWHRVRKARAGAYRRRRIEMDIFTLISPDKRKRFVVDDVGSHWPKQMESLPDIRKRIDKRCQD